MEFKVLQIRIKNSCGSSSLIMSKAHNKDDISLQGVQRLVGKQSGITVRYHMVANIVRLDESTKTTN